MLNFLSGRHEYEYGNEGQGPQAREQTVYGKDEGHTLSDQTRHMGRITIVHLCSKRGTQYSAPRP